MLKICNESTIYVLCPPSCKTGGTELLHQLVFQLNKLSKKACIVYCPQKDCDMNHPTPEAFKGYVEEWVLLKNVVDSEKNVLVLPEIYVKKHSRFKRIQKCIWWLSVDNYLMAADKKWRIKQYGWLSFFKHFLMQDYCSRKELKSMDVHLYQSHYAADFIKKLDIMEEKMHHLSDYINDEFFSEFDMTEKRDIVIYNPQKGMEYTQKLVELGIDIQWIPIIGMSNHQVHQLMRSAKVYIDFGNHPGKDRMPREAAISGCCIITNKKGSAAYSQDVPINDKYKFDDADEYVLECIRECFKEYESKKLEFEDYRRMILGEKDRFIEDIKAIFLMNYLVENGENCG